MLTTWWNSPVALALTAAVFYAGVPMLSKIAMVQLGASPTGLLFGYAALSFTMTIALHAFGVVQISWGAGLRALPWALLIGLLTSSAFILMNRGLQIPSAPISLVLGLIAISPILASLLEVISREVSIPWWRAVGGCALVVAGGLTLTTGKIRIPKHELLSIGATNETPK